MVIKIRRRFALVVFILLFLIFFKYNIDKNLSFLKIEKKINSSLINKSEENKNTVKLFCMIITQNKSLRNKILNSFEGNRYQYPHKLRVKTQSYTFEFLPMNANISK